MTVVGTKPHPIFLAGRWVESPDVLEVANPANAAEPAGATYNATPEQYEEAVEAAVAAFEVTRHLPAYERGRILRDISAGIKARREELGRLIALEAGKPIRDALVEVDRAVLTFRLGAEEAERMTGELIPLDLMPTSARTGSASRAASRSARSRRSARSTSRSTSPRTSSRRRSRAGNPIVLKPPSKDPLTMLTVAEIIEAAGSPAGSVSILPMTRELGDRMVADDRFKLLTFTGSPSVGWRMKERAGKKKVVLELGGNAGVIVDQTADLDWAVKRLARRRLRLCRPGVHQRPADVRPRGDLGRVHGASSSPVSATLKLGDPLDPTTDVGPMVDENQAPRTQRWVDEAVAMGGQVLAGGKADGTFFPPTVLTDVPVAAQVCSNEAFAPLVVAFKFGDLDDAIRQVNDSHVRAADRGLHQRPGGRLASVQRARGRRRHRQRRPDLPDRPHALRRGQGLGPRARGPALGDGGHDRDPDHGARPARLTCGGRGRRGRRPRTSSGGRRRSRLPLRSDGPWCPPRGCGWSACHRRRTWRTRRAVTRSSWHTG